MKNDSEIRKEVRQPGGPGTGSLARWEPPRFEVIPLDCEITAYAPDGDDPLF